MKLIKKKIFVSVFILLAAALVVLGWYFGNAVPIGTGSGLPPIKKPGLLMSLLKT